MNLSSSDQEIIMLFMTHRHNLHRALFLNRLEDPISIQPEFPQSKRIGLEWFLIPRSDLRIRLQMRDDSSHDNALFMDLEVSNVSLGTFCERDPILHSWIVPEKPLPLKFVTDRAQDACPACFSSHRFVSFLLGIFLAAHCDAGAASQVHLWLSAKKPIS